MIEKVELRSDTVSCELRSAVLALAHLNDIVAEMEDNRILHSIVLDEEVHVSRAAFV